MLEEAHQEKQTLEQKRQRKELECIGLAAARLPEQVAGNKTVAVVAVVVAAGNKTVAVVAVVVAAGNKTVAVVSVVVVDKMAIIVLCFAERCNSKQGYNLDNTVMNISLGSFLNKRKIFVS